MERLLGKYLAIWTSLYVSFKHTVISITNFMGTTKFMGILDNTSLLTESTADGLSQVFSNFMYYLTNTKNLINS
jgi:hypothetical protein